jgi:hypothetical protein
MRMRRKKRAEPFESKSKELPKESGIRRVRFRASAGNNDSIYDQTGKLHKTNESCSSESV